MAAEQSPLMSIGETCQRLNVSARTVRRMIAARQLRAVRVRKLWRIPREDVERLATPDAIAPVRAVSGSGAGEKTAASGRLSPDAVAVWAAPASEPVRRFLKRRPWETSGDNEKAASRA